MRFVPRFLPLVLLAAVLAPPTARAQDDPFALAALEQNNAITKSELLSEVTAIAPGKPFTVALKLTHKEGWHSYFHNDGIGISGIPTLTWTLPEGFEAGEIQWPIPHLATFVGLQTYGYEGTNYFFATITPPAGLKTGSTVEIALEAKWQTCKENCINEKGSHKLSLPVAAAPAANETVASGFNAYRKTHSPGAQPKDWKVSANDEAGEITIRIKNGQELGDGLYFFDYDGQVDPQVEQNWTSPEAGVWELKIRRNKGNTISDKAGPVLEQLNGILSSPGVLPGTDHHGVWLEAPIEAPPVGIGRLLAILGGMFIGGMILNLMPCVFPVIGLKIMGFVQQAGEDRKKIAVHGFIYAAGVVLSFWVLAGTLLALREGVLGGGKDVSWGYQLQNPWVVWGLMLVMFVLALNMFGVFEIGTSATGVGSDLTRKQGASGSFFSGILATVVATPCSAPFLGAAMGAAFGFPPFLFMLAFTVMALGLAFPYIVLSLFPKLVEKLPRPGPWMESFKQAMSFLLFATAGFLLWVYVAQIELASMLKVVIGLTALATGLWIYGRWCVISKAKRTRTTGIVVAIVFSLFGLAASKPPRKGMEWFKWSEETVEQALDEGRPVYVDFTATWCLTCQVNKANAYPKKVQELFKKYNVLVLKADNTNEEPEIDAAIRSLGRALVPVNVLYVPGDDEPKLTPELFSAGFMVDFLNEHLAGAGDAGDSADEE